MKIETGTKLFIAEGEKRGYTMSIHDEELKIISMEKAGRGLLFKYLPGYLTMTTWANSEFEGGLHWFNSKPGCKKIMAEAGLPVPKTYQEALIQTTLKKDQWEYPAVVKPYQGEESRNVFINVDTAEEVNDAIQFIWSTGEDALVEQFISGNHYRLLMYGEEVLACIQRRSPSVVGNSRSTVQELVDERNTEPERGPVDDYDFVFHPIIIDDTTVQLLLEQGLKVDSIVLDGQRVYTHNRISAAVGSDYVDVLDNTHKQYLEYGRALMRKYPLQLIGFDIIAEDISQPPINGEVAFNEYNLYPALGLMQSCNEGIQRPVASMIWDRLEASDNIITEEMDQY